MRDCGLRDDENGATNESFSYCCAAKKRNPTFVTMRLVENIPHPRVKISIMSYNDKWIIEIEGGQYRQTFKIGHDSVNGVEDVKKLITEELLEHTFERFNGMHTDFAEAFKKLNS